MAAQADTSVTRPVDTLEVRWMVPGEPGAPMREWFARFPAKPAEVEIREDAYLLQPSLPGLSVKLRNAHSLDVKTYLGSPGILDLPGRCRGRLESWRKFSFTYQQPGPRDVTPMGWGTVRKRRRRSWFPLVTCQSPAPDMLPAAPAGCFLELTEARLNAESWWSVGFEAIGPASLPRAALEHAADLVFGQALPPGIEFSLDNSLSYAEWLGQRPDPDRPGSARLGRRRPDTGFHRGWRGLRQ